MKLQTIIFSKDRPLQLHGTLESLRLRCRDALDFSVAVLFRATDPHYAEGYHRLKEEFSSKLHVTWIEEKDFKADLLSLLQDPRTPMGLWKYLPGWKPRARFDFVMFLVDDNLFIRNFGMNLVVKAIQAQPEAIGFSLRVGRNTTYCYSNRCDQAFPDFTSVSDGVLEFPWHGSEGDFGYPLEVSSSVYRTADVLGILARIPYTNPNRLEQGFSVARLLLTRRLPRLLCFEQSVAFCAPVNKVQSILDNRAGDSEAYSSEALNGLFLGGSRIDVEKLNGFMPISAHQEIELPLMTNA